MTVRININIAVAIATLERQSLNFTASLPVRHDITEFSPRYLFAYLSTFIRTFQSKGRCNNIIFKPPSGRHIMTKYVSYQVRHEDFYSYEYENNPPENIGFVGKLRSDLLPQHNPDKANDKRYRSDQQTGK